MFDGEAMETVLWCISTFVGRITDHELQNANWHLKGRHILREKWTSAFLSRSVCIKIVSTAYFCFERSANLTYAAAGDGKRKHTYFSFRGTRIGKTALQT